MRTKTMPCQVYLTARNNKLITSSARHTPRNSPTSIEFLAARSYTKLSQSSIPVKAASPAQSTRITFTDCPVDLIQASTNAVLGSSLTLEANPWVNILNGLSLLNDSGTMTVASPPSSTVQVMFSPINLQITSGSWEGKNLSEEKYLMVVSLARVSQSDCIRPGAVADMAGVTEHNNRGISLLAPIIIPSTVLPH